MLMEISLALLHSNVLPRKNRREFCSFKRLPELNLTKKNKFPFTQPTFTCLNLTMEAS